MNRSCLRTRFWLRRPRLASDSSVAPALHRLLDGEPVGGRLQAVQGGDDGADLGAGPARGGDRRRPGRCRLGRAAARVERPQPLHRSGQPLVGDRLGLGGEVGERAADGQRREDGEVDRAAEAQQHDDEQARQALRGLALQLERPQLDRRADVLAAACAGRRARWSCADHQDCGLTTTGRPSAASDRDAARSGPTMRPAPVSSR